MSASGCSSFAHHKAALTGLLVAAGTKSMRHVGLKWQCKPAFITQTCYRPAVTIASGSAGRQSCTQCNSLRSSLLHAAKAHSTRRLPNQICPRPRRDRSAVRCADSGRRSRSTPSSTGSFDNTSSSSIDEPSVVKLYDEPEAAVLLVACFVGLVTGGGVVLFNDVIHGIRHLAWSTTPLESTYWGLWARELPLSDWPTLVLPPTLGGAAVGLIKVLAGGFDTASEDVGTTPAKPLLRQVTQELAGLRSLVTGAADDRLEPGSEAPPVQPQQAVEAAAGAPAIAWQRRLRGALKPVLKATAAAVTLGSGASLGPEGPSVEIGKATAQGLGTVLRSKQRRLVALTAAGTGAGLSAGFNAPISGAFFAVETILLAEQPEASSERPDRSPGLTIAMILLSAVLAAVVSQAGLGSSPAVKVPDYQLTTLLELPLIIVFGAACGLVAAAFSASNKLTSQAFSRLRRNGVLEAVMPAIGGAATGIAALRYPEVLYQGFGNVNAILLNKGDYAPGLLLQILGVKIVCTSICRGSGLVGGIYAPSIFMGATLGSAFGGLARGALLPLGMSVTEPQAYALVGAAAMLAANCRVPLTAVLLLFELTRDYSILIPTLAAVGMSNWVASQPALLAAFSPAEVVVMQDGSSSSDMPAAEDSGYLDATSVTEQLGMGIVGDAGSPEEARATVFDRQHLPPAGQRRRDALQAAIGPAGADALVQQQPPAVLGSMDASPGALQGASVECALEEACVLLTADTSMADALAIMEDASQTVALVVDLQGAVVGVLTRERILRELAASSPGFIGSKFTRPAGSDTPQRPARS